VGNAAGKAAGLQFSITESRLSHVILNSRDPFIDEAVVIFGAILQLHRNDSDKRCR
jgi:hypothetical protein